MRTKILVAGFACLSVLAAAQQQSSNPQAKTTKEVKSPRDLATGQASGRHLNRKADDQPAGPNAAAREASTGKATGKTMAHDDWHAQSAATSGDPHVKNVSSGDQPAGVRESPTKASSGQTTAPRATDDAARLRESPSKASLGQRESPSKPTTQVTAGDVNGDGRADKTASQSSVQSPRDSSTGMASGKRQHGSISVTKREQAPASTESAPKK